MNKRVDYSRFQMENEEWRGIGTRYMSLSYFIAQ